MSSSGGTEPSFDPRTWLSGSEKVGALATPGRPNGQPVATKTARQLLLASLAGAGILIAGATAAYATREPPSAVDAAFQS